jgi:hypothetical protein
VEAALPDHEGAMRGRHGTMTNAGTRMTNADARVVNADAGINAQTRCGWVCTQEPAWMGIFSSAPSCAWVCR